MGPGFRRGDNDFCDAGSECDARSRRFGDRILARLRLDVAGDLATAFDLDLAVANRAGNAARGTDEEPLADYQVALEPPAHVDLVDRRRTLEQPGLGDIDIVAVLQIGLDAALDNQLVARGDLARQRDFAADDQSA